MDNNLVGVFISHLSHKINKSMKLLKTIMLLGYYYLVHKFLILIRFLENLIWIIALFVLSPILKLIISFSRDSLGEMIEKVQIELEKVQERKLAWYEWIELEFLKYIFYWEKE